LAASADVEFEAFVLRASERLLRVAFLLTGDRGHAEDLLQTALLRTARRWRAAREAPDAYARRALVNLSHDRWRRLKSRPSEDLRDRDASVAVEADRAEEVLDRNTMGVALQQLPLRQRQVVVLRFFLDLSVAETAAAIGCSQGSVKSHCNRALARLRQLLAEPAGLSSRCRREPPDKKTLVIPDEEVHRAE
jgi:RNA polymerase sigma-70 factor (sigma-E family)